MTQLTQPSCEVIILTALPIEYQAVLHYLEEPQEVVHPSGTIYHHGRFRGEHQMWCVAVAQIALGGPSAALETERAIQFFGASIALFVGVAGGLSDVSFGDVIAATKIHAYEYGKDGTTFEPRPEQWKASYALLQRAQAEARTDAWLTRVNNPGPDAAPRVFVGPLAAGEKAVASTQSDVARRLRAIYGDTLAVETEGHGFLQAVHANHSVHGLVVRGISNLIDDKAEAEAAGWSDVAARHAAAFAFQVLSKFTEAQRGEASSLPSVLPVPLNNQKQERDPSNFLPQKAIQEYLSELVEATKTFLLPGLQVRLPIEHAWIHLNVLEDSVEVARPSTLEEKMAFYHEWERLSYHDQHIYSVQDVTEFAHRVVVIGGPGAGKSTLCQRTVHRLARSGKLVLRVQLSHLGERLKRGESINEALLCVAQESSSIRSELLVGLLNGLECLLADGLDECDHGVEVAERLRLWAYARPHIRVVVTTRPIGYDRAYFEGWQHLELLPLDRNRIKDYARCIFQQIETDPAMLAHKLQQFQAQIKTKRTPSIAARSPLLLGFLVQLVHHHVDVAQHRAQLYEQILTLWYKTHPKDRNLTTPHTRSSYAHEVLNRIGWYLQHSSFSGVRSRQGVIDALAIQLCENGQSLLAAKEQVEDCLTFWQERGVLELLQVGCEEAYIFVHPTLGEYLAGRYITTCSDEDIKTFVEEVRYNARWREVLLFAAGAGKANLIAEHLLRLEREDDPIATESLLAAAVLTETSQPSPGLVLNIAKRLTSRLCSTIPAIAYESAQQSVGLAAQLAEEMKPLLDPLVRHPQWWTRLVVLRLALAAGDTVVDFDALEACFDEWIVPKRFSDPGEVASPRTASEIRKYILRRREPWGICNEILTLGAEALVRERPGEATAKRLERFARLESDVSDQTRQVLLEQLKQLGSADLVAEITREYRARLGERLPWDVIWRKCRQADHVLLQAVLRVTGTTHYREVGLRQPVALSMLIHALHLPECGIKDWLILKEQDDNAALDTVLIGTMVALNLDPTEVAADAIWALPLVMEQLQASNDGATLLSLLPKLPVEPDWGYAAEKANLLASHLVRALCHPSRAIAISAAELLVAGAGGRDVSSMLEDMLDQGDDLALQMVAPIADSVWKDEALAKVLHRLNGPLSRGCRWLLQVLPHLDQSQANGEIREALVRGLNADDPYVTIAAAETLQSFPRASVEPILAHVQAAFTLWSTRGDYCEHHQCYVCGTCCNGLLLCPRAQILKILIQFSVLSLHEWLDAYCDRHHDVQTVAAQGVAHVLASEPKDIVEVLAEVAKGCHPSALLETILSLPTSALMTAQKALLSLFSSESAILRRIMVRNVATATWLTKEQAVRAAQVALVDSDLTVRNLAVATLRSLECSS